MKNYIGILDGGGEAFGVRIPDLPGCFGGGATPEAAVADAMSAAPEWIAHRESKERAAPKPSATVSAATTANFFICFSLLASGPQKPVLVTLPRQVKRESLPTG